LTCRSRYQSPGAGSAGGGIPRRQRLVADRGDEREERRRGQWQGEHGGGEVGNATRRTVALRTPMAPASMVSGCRGLAAA
jgi:hypothetical protein